MDGVRVSRLVREKLKEQRQRRRPQWLQRGMIPLHLLCNIEAEWPMRAFLCLFLGPPFPATYVGFLFHEGRKMGRDLSFAFQPSFPTAAESERGREKEDYVVRTVMPPHAALLSGNRPSVRHRLPIIISFPPLCFPRSLPLSFTAVTGDEVSCRPQPASQSRAARRGRRCGDYRSPC